MQMTEIEKVKAEIKLLESKLSFLEELEKTKTPCEIAFKRVYGRYPVTDIDGSTWTNFEKGYDAAQEDYQVGEHQPEPKKPETLYDILRELDKPMFTDDVCRAVKEWLPDPIQDDCDEYTNAWNAGWNSYHQTLIDTLGGE
jgi:hypothetical protein